MNTKVEQKSVKNLVDFLGDLKTPKIHSEINWPEVRRCYYYNLGFNPTCFIISCHVEKHGCKLEVCNNTLHNGKIWWILSMLSSSHIVYKLYAWAKYVRHSFAFLLWQGNLWVWLSFPNKQTICLSMYLIFFKLFPFR